VETIGNITDEVVQKNKRAGRRIKERRFERYRFIAKKSNRF
jgi:hypothetical protein